LVIEKLFLFSCATSRSFIATSDTTTALDKLESFLEKYSKEEEVETDLFEKTCCLDVEISFEWFEMSELEEKCDTHNE
jgi:hypothetical protein